MNYYTTLFADQRKGKRKAMPFLALFHGAWQFFRTFVLGRGFLYKQDGFVICLIVGLSSYFKYAKLYERNNCLNSRAQSNEEYLRSLSRHNEE